MQRLDICKLAFEAYTAAGLFKECVDYLQQMVQLLGHSAFLWYLIATAHYRSGNHVLCLQALENCLVDLDRSDVYVG